MFKILFSILFLLHISLSTGIMYSMPVDVTPDQPAMPDTAAPAMPSTAAPAMPDTAASPAPSTEMPAQAQPAAPYEEVKSEQLGEFEVKEDLSEIIKNVDPKIIILIRKSNEINKQINEITTDIQNMRDNLFNKFTDTNSMLEAFYQKIGFECGKIKESFKEDK